MTTHYIPRRVSRSAFTDARGLRHHLRCWGDPAAPTLLMLHGWMDVSASFQFVVDGLARERFVIAPDWRGFGLSAGSGADAYWFPDYLGDLDALLDAWLPDQPVDIVAHSMGGNIAMLYAGVRPQRVRRLVNLEGFGMRAAEADSAPGRMAEWLDSLKTPARLRDYPSLEAVAARLQADRPRLSADKAAFLAAHWATQVAPGRFVLRGDPAHKRVNPYPYRLDEVLATWRCISAPVLLVSASEHDAWHAFVKTEAYQERLKAIPQLAQARVDEAGHMLHHDQPERVAALIEGFIDA